MSQHLRTPDTSVIFSFSTSTSIPCPMYIFTSSDLQLQIRNNSPRTNSQFQGSANPCTIFFSKSLHFFHLYCGRELKLQLLWRYGFLHLCSKYVISALWNGCCCSAAAHQLCIFSRLLKKAAAHALLPFPLFAGIYCLQIQSESLWKPYPVVYHLSGDFQLQ